MPTVARKARKNYWTNWVEFVPEDERSRKECRNLTDEARTYMEETVCKHIKFLLLWQKTGCLKLPAGLIKRVFPNTFGQPIFDPLLYTY